MSLNQLASMYKVDRSTIMSWKDTYEIFGIEGLEESNSWKSYTKELKLAAVHDYLSGSTL